MVCAPVTYLFVPATRPERFAKAFAAGADAVIADLEDAVDPQDKTAARQRLDEVLAGGQHRLWLRINAVGTQWFSQDLALAQKHRTALAGVVLSKTESAADLQALDCELPVLGLIESARGLLALGDICHHPRITRLAFGAVDFSVDLGCEDGWDMLLPARMQLVTHCAAARLPPPVDGVTLELQRSAIAQRDAARAARLGFGAKLCIHPSQLEPVMRGFAPSPDQILWASGVVAMAQQAGSGARRLNGQMVDRPVVERARRILERRALLPGDRDVATSSLT